MTDPILAESSYSHDMDVSIDRIDIADWLAHLGNAEFQRCCSPDHIACGFTHTDDGRPMSINVETVGPSCLSSNTWQRCSRRSSVGWSRCQMCSRSVAGERRPWLSGPLQSSPSARGAAASSIP